MRGARQQQECDRASPYSKPHPARPPRLTAVRRQAQQCRVGLPPRRRHGMGAALTTGRQLIPAGRAAHPANALQAQRASRLKRRWPVAARRRGGAGGSRRVCALGSSAPGTTTAFHWLKTCGVGQGSSFHSVPRRTDPLATSRFAESASEHERDERHLRHIRWEGATPSHLRLSSRPCGLH